MTQAHIILIDNFDSFTYNLVDQCRCLDYPVTIYRNNVKLSTIIQAVNDQANSILLFSPGPGKPEDAGCILELIEHFKGQVPMLGICLGHQALVAAYGGTVSSANKIVHGKSSIMQCQPHPLFDTLPNELPIARYHSLVATQVPNTLQTIAESEGLVMAITHHSDRVIGMQFHPESILTTTGEQLLHNALHWLQTTNTSTYLPSHPTS